MKIKKSSGNVYADLGSTDANGMAIKARLAMKIDEAINDRGWTLPQAARVLGMAQSELSQMLRGRFRGISETKMLDCLALLGCNVQTGIEPGGTNP